MSIRRMTTYALAGAAAAALAIGLGLGAPALAQGSGDAPQEAQPQVTPQWTMGEMMRRMHHLQGTMGRMMGYPGTGAGMMGPGSMHGPGGMMGGQGSMHGRNGMTAGSPGMMMGGMQGVSALGGTMTGMMQQMQALLDNSQLMDNQALAQSMMQMRRGMATMMQGYQGLVTGMGALQSKPQQKQPEQPR